MATSASARRPCLAPFSQPRRSGLPIGDPCKAPIHNILRHSPRFPPLTASPVPGRTFAANQHRQWTGKESNPGPLGPPICSRSRPHGPSVPVGQAITASVVRSVRDRTPSGRPTTEHQGERRGSEGTTHGDLHLGTVPSARGGLGAWRSFAPRTGTHVLPRGWSRTTTNLGGIRRTDEDVQRDITLFRSHGARHRHREDR